MHSVVLPPTASTRSASPSGGSSPRVPSALTEKRPGPATPGMVAASGTKTTSIPGG